MSAERELYTRLTAAIDRWAEEQTRPGGILLSEAELKAAPSLAAAQAARRLKAALEPSERRSPPMDYDPNLVFCGHLAQQLVRLTFGQWKARAVMEVTVFGNCTGLSVIQSAVERAYEQLLMRNSGKFAEIVMQDGEDILTCEDDHDDETWLADMLICAEIISITPIKNTKPAPPPAEAAA